MVLVCQLLIFSSALAIPRTCVTVCSNRYLLSATLDLHGKIEAEKHTFKFKLHRHTFKFKETHIHVQSAIQLRGWFSMCLQRGLCLLWLRMFTLLWLCREMRRVDENGNVVFNINGIVYVFSFILSVNWVCIPYAWNFTAVSSLWLETIIILQSNQNVQRIWHSAAKIRQCS